MGKVLLLVDDNAEFLDSTKDVLEEAGYKVMTAPNGSQALSLVREHAFDVVLMDIKMPGMNGVETFMKMKEQNPGVNVILLTAYSLVELIQQALKEGVSAVLNKPLKISMLFQTIEEVCRTRRGGCILIADDDSAQCESLGDALEHSGYRVVMAHNGAEVVERMGRESFDILLLDMKLPGMNGLEIYRKVKKDHPQILTIIITGYFEEFLGLLQQAMDESVYTCIRKPVDVKRLLDLMQTGVAARLSGGRTKPGREAFDGNENGFGCR